MAHPEHVEIVKKGKDAIAAWRESHSLPNFLDLRGADLCMADLHKADLRMAYLREANLSEADLGNADLRGANLTETDLRGANLNKADMSFAILHAANLGSANLCGTNLEKARIGQVSFGDVDLSDVRGLDTVVHRGPSTIGVDTLFRSRGLVPEVFLRGCGVPETLITHLPGLIEGMSPIQFYSCFISHSGKDDDFARRLCARLRDEKLRVWFAPEDMRGGRKSDEQIDQAIRVYDRLLLVLSENSMGSEWVRREIEQARRKERESKCNVLFPIGLVSFDRIKKWDCLDSDTGEDLAEKIREYHIPDFSNWKDHDAFEAGFAKLMEDLRAEAAAGTALPDVRDAGGITR